MNASGPSRLSFLIHLCGYILLAGILAASAYLVHSGQWAGAPPSADARNTWLQLILPAALGMAAVWGALWWLLVRRSFRKPGAEVQPDAALTATDAAEEKQTAADRRRYREQRLYLHLVASLQREGRLLDFLNENLDEFEDAQIGAAVRSIHGACRKVLWKALSPASVLADAEEASTVTIDAGTDAAAVKMVGNVTGPPPFTGVVRHKGWRAQTIDLPEFTGSQSSEILAPAEVEIN